MVVSCSTTCRGGGGSFFFFLISFIIQSSTATKFSTGCQGQLEPIQAVVTAPPRETNQHLHPRTFGQRIDRFWCWSETNEATQCVWLYGMLLRSRWWSSDCKARALTTVPLRMANAFCLFFFLITKWRKTKKAHARFFFFFYAHVFLDVSFSSTYFTLNCI